MRLLAGYRAPMPDAETPEEPAGRPMPPDVVESEDGTAPLLDDPDENPGEGGGVTA